MHVAAASNHLEFIVHLLELGADVDVQTQVRIVFLHHSSQINSFFIIFR